MEQALLGHNLGQQCSREETSLMNSFASSTEEYPSFVRDTNLDMNNVDTLRRLLEQVRDDECDATVECEKLLRVTFLST